METWFCGSLKTQAATFPAYLQGMETFVCQNPLARYRSVPSLPTRNGNIEFIIIMMSEKDGSQPTYKEWKQLLEPVL